MERLPWRVIFLFLGLLFSYQFLEAVWDWMATHIPAILIIFTSVFFAGWGWAFLKTKDRQIAAQAGTSALAKAGVLGLRTVWGAVKILFRFVSGFHRH